MEKLKNVSNKIFDILEIYIPMICFFLMFVSYVILILYRYILKDSIGWLNEINVILFVWSCVFASSYGSRSGEHVSFDILYDVVSDRKQILFRIVGDLFIFVTFIILLPHAFSSVQVMEMKKSSIMKIPYDLLYSPFLVFIILTLIHKGVALIKDFKILGEYSKVKVEQ